MARRWGRPTIMGLVKQQRRLDKIPQEIKEQVKREMERQADQIVAQMKASGPADSGKLRNTIGWTWGRLGKGQHALAQAKNALGSEMTLTVYAGDASTRVDHGSGERQLARLIEFGTRTMKAQPFFYPVWRARKKKARAAIRKSVGEAVKAATKS